MKEHTYTVSIFYEHTDVAGLVYHSYFLNFMEQARSSIFGLDNLVTLLNEKGIGFVAHDIHLSFSDSVKFGDTLDIKTTYKKEGEYKLIFHQEAWVRGSSKAAVKADIEMVCIDKNKKILPVNQPPVIL
jgi:acyl-CoA thioester hydrolase